MVLYLCVMWFGIALSSRINWEYLRAPAIMYERALVQTGVYVMHTTHLTTKHRVVTSSTVRLMEDKKCKITQQKRRAQ